MPHVRADHTHDAVDEHALRGAARVIKACRKHDARKTIAGREELNERYMMEMYADERIDADGEPRTTAADRVCRSGVQRVQHRDAQARMYARAPCA
jgi:hypothetical protein